ncbi:hypothetical protein RB2501_03665 [Robiginitalea biformata HTCC2501]|uniref:Uncharacterized protein n=1 Tax=Robiginitalea biformata (strain ATCC BAA-864 / DSM 15991 / KCTC 12146 / HTCC2501) TaxID=313596 RepID=A4CGA3_ROBBH|nr:hypothetical protein RB2501_03665 [Robiginitalea biformata HTCC2501]
MFVYPRGSDVAFGLPPEGPDRAGKNITLQSSRIFPVENMIIINEIKRIGPLGHRGMWPVLLSLSVI